MRLLITPDPLDAPALLAAFQAANRTAGAIASFVGQVRGEGVEALELELYDGFTQPHAEAGLAPIAAGVGAFLVAHRFGRLLAGETIVVVAAASPHRRAALQAVDRAMDWLKTEAAFWKREHGPAGPCWIEPRGQDYEDAARWRRVAP